MASSVPFTPLQTQQLTHLWKSHARQLVDVKLSSEQDDHYKVPNHAFAFAQRLHTFFVAFLKQQSEEDKNRFVRDHSISSLHPYLRLAYPDGSSTATTSTQLKPGRHVISIHHEEFLQELNQYETQDENPPADFVRRQSFGAFLHHRPQEALPAIGCAMALAIITLSTNHLGITSIIDATQIIVRFAHVLPRIQMMDVKTGLVGKLLSLKGHVVKAQQKTLSAATADFRCTKCRTCQTHSFSQGRYSTPTKCIDPGCRGRTFTMSRSSVHYVDKQEIRLQEAQEENTAQAGRSPRQMEVELTHDLVDQCRPGDIVLVAAIVTAINTAAGQRRAKESTTYKLFLTGHSVSTMSESSNRDAKASNEVTFTQKQLENIVQLCHADHRYFSMVERRAFPFDLLVRSICPAIIGHNEVKAGLLLCLLGGTPAQTSEKGNTIRSNAHILIVGDPGMGKSQMLLAATQLAARSVYVGGNTSSTTGLTVTMTKEQNGEPGIEAGALVLADQGVCAIDEFDKMAKAHQDGELYDMIALPPSLTFARKGLLEAMEQQQVSIAKAGIVASLAARCSVLAAANPKHGSYNMSKTVAENLNMAKPILSRFDLVFILRDRANANLDRLVSSNIMNLHRANAGGPGSNCMAEAETQHQYDHSQPKNGDRMSLPDRLQWVNSFQKQALPADLVRDYIAYAREYCKPKLTPEAASVLKDYYMKLRYPSGATAAVDTVPITTRQLEALIRLCQARAKACLRDFVLEEDALDVVELMGLSNEQVHSDENGALDRTRGGAGGQSNRKLKKRFVAELHRVIGIGAECNLEDLRRVAETVNCGLSEFHGVIEDIRNDGVLLRKPGGAFRISS